MEFIDRQVRKPNRFKITSDDGTVFYAVLERADEPILPGTPLNAATFNELLALIKSSGADGKSAYQVALDYGFEGTEEEWLASLKGKDGKSIERVYLKNGTGEDYHYKCLFVETYNPETGMITAGINLGRVEGAAGEDGDDGVDGINGASVDSVHLKTGEDGYLHLYATTRPAYYPGTEVLPTETDLGRVEGKRGEKSEILLLADAWVGEQAPYSQEVSIPTVTPNTQVDLTPSVEQLSIFYNKDLAFVTENEEGVVTVYAIGQKPTQDYTIQVTMTEVSI